MCLISSQWYVKGVLYVFENHWVFTLSLHCHLPWLKNSPNLELFGVIKKSYVLVTVEPAHLCDITHFWTVTQRKMKLWCYLNHSIFCVSLFQWLTL